MSVRGQVIEIIAEQAMLDAAEVDGTKTLDDLGIDSVALVECIFAIEEAFDIQVPYNANQPDASEFDLSTVDTIVAAVDKLIAAQKSGE